MLGSLVRSALGRSGYMLVKYRTPRGGFGNAAAGDAAPATYAPDMEPEFQALHQRCRAFTMTPVERMYNLYIAMRHVLRHGVAGDIVECGVWRGGSAMLCALMLEAAGDEDRRVWLYDTFSGMAAPTDKDLAADGTSTREIWEASRRGGHNDWCFAPLDDVKANMASTGIRADRVVCVQGKVEDTLPATRPDQIALLRLDTDWYESTKAELAHLYPRVSTRGVLLVDDYGQWLGQRQAVDEYFGELDDGLVLCRIDHNARMGIKPGDARGENRR